MIHTPGIYFGLPAAEYHADESFSASGVKNLLVSPLTFWTRSNMNPRRKDEPTPAMKFGSACDVMIVEGPEAFNEAYAVRPRIEDHPDAIDGAEALRARCAELGLKKGGSIAELCVRILEADPAAELWPCMLGEWRNGLSGQEEISGDWYADIVNRAQIVRNHSEVKRAFSGGYPQVSIFWVADNGIPMKARVDYLKTKIGLDLKTFSNSLDKPLSVAVAHAMAFQKHGIQAAVYMEGIERAKTLIRLGNPTPVFGEVDGNWIDAFVEREEHQFGFIFVESGDVPNVLGRRFRKYMPNGGLSLAFSSADAAYRAALAIYADCLKRHGTAPWIETEPMRDFEDEEFPMWTMEAA